MAPARGPLRRFYTPYEVAQHNTPSDCWVSFLGGVYDISKLIKNNPGKISEPLMKAAGSDISHWFDPRTRDIRTMICPVTQLERFYTPQGMFPHIPPIEPVGNWDTSFGIPWWRDKQYQLGRLSSKLRVVRIKNVLTGQEDNMEVPCEETVVEIRERYLELNWHSKSYTVKALVRTPEQTFEFVELDMNKTLAENGVPDEDATFADLQVPIDSFYPVLHMYWNDDLTVA
ncbi:hypothetical protein DUNSADRAFT_2455 [Dunaliella salina]|uniref:Cytochrome b5 domain-containing protein 1 n=1 Tax=Dunaliella salina TaxID=3046 RepID=A0ABQ7FWB2_DUNSA|nr:hypothetical protein DUNSADRAFT_2455 [Dunaliella salina]|eukprot:KAF5826644.1 hypothetical protein DUNSADRAFT_2455 [Dunaliella salina]